MVSGSHLCMCIFKQAKVFCQAVNLFENEKKFKVKRKGDERFSEHLQVYLHQVTPIQLTLSVSIIPDFQIFFKYTRMYCILGG